MPLTLTTTPRTDPGACSGQPTHFHFEIIKPKLRNSLLPDHHLEYIKGKFLDVMQIENSFGIRRATGLSGWLRADPPVIYHLEFTVEVHPVLH